MSILNCDKCQNQIDTDDDPDSYDGESDSWVCHTCRKEEESYWRAQYNIAPLSERNPAQYREDMIASGRGHLLKDE